SRARLAGDDRAGVGGIAVAPQACLIERATNCSTTIEFARRACHDLRAMTPSEAGATTSAVTERPISFNAQMVRAILDGRKTQTRRIATAAEACPFGAIGD